MGGVWLRDYLLCFATCTCLPSFSTGTACRSKEFSSSTAQQSFVDLNTRNQAWGGGGLTARLKRKSSLLRPPPSFTAQPYTSQVELSTCPTMALCINHICSAQDRYTAQVHSTGKDLRA